MRSAFYSLLFFALIGFLFLLSSCQACRNSKPVIRLGEQTWTFQELQAYMKLRLSPSHTLDKPEELKEQFLQEILFQALLKNWSQREQIQIKSQTWNRKDFILFFSKPSKLKALKEYQKFVLLKSSLMDSLKKQIPNPDLKTQKAFYQKNKALFFEPARCQLEQILVENKSLAKHLFKRLKKGESFDVLAKNHSLKRGPGWVEKGQLEVFDVACFKTQDPLSSPLKSPYGYHIFLKKAQKTGQQKSFLESQEQILSFLKKKKLDSSFRKWLKEESLKKSLWIDKKSLEQIKIQYKKHD